MTNFIYEKQLMQQTRSIQNQYGPYIINTCSHSLCSSCLNNKAELCPICQRKFQSKYLNWDLFKILPDSEYDKLKSDLEQTLEKVKLIKKEIYTERSKLFKKSSLRIYQLQNEIDLESENVISLIKKNRDKIIQQTKCLEDYLKKSLNEIRVDDLKQIDFDYENNDYSMDDLLSLNVEAKNLKSSLQAKKEQLASFDDDYEFACLRNKTVTFGEIGAIVGKDWPLNPITEAEFVRKGDYLSEQLKSYEKALDCYAQAIQMNPNSAEAFNSKGNALFEMKQYEDAIKCFTCSIRINPGYIKAYNNKGNCYFALKQFDNAIKQFNKAINLDPNYLHAYNGKGNSFFEKQNYSHALECFKKAIKIDPTCVIAYNGLGNVLVKTNELDQALDNYSKAIALDPLYVHAYFGKATALKEKHEYDEAFEYFNKTIQLDSSYIQAFHGKGDLLREKKDLSGAIEQYNKAIAINSNSEISECVDSFYNLGVVYFEKNEHKKAFELIDKAVMLDRKLKFNIEIQS